MTKPQTAPDAPQYGSTVDLLTWQTRILEYVARGAPMGDTLNLIAVAIEEQLPGTRCSILLYDAATRSLRHGAAPSLPETYRRAIDGVVIGPSVGSCGTAAYFRKTVVVSDIARDELWDNYRGFALTHDLRSCWSAPIVSPTTGELLGTFALYRDVPHLPSEGERRLTEQFGHLAAVSLEKTRLVDALRQSEERFRQTFEENAAGMALVGLDGRYIEVNRALCEMVDRLPEELVGRSYEAICHDDDRARVRATVECMTHGDVSSAHARERYVRSDGEVVWTDVIRTLFKDAAGRPLHLCVQLVDVTERRQVDEERQARRLAEAAREAAEEASRAKSEFLGRLSHELRTPLNAILGFAQLMQLTCVSDKQRQNVGHILRAGNHMTGVIAEVLDLARVEAGRLRFDSAPTSVAQIAGDVVDLTRPLARTREVVVHNDVSSDAFVVGDRQRLRQVLINLVGNGIKYNRPGGSVRVWTRPGSDGRLVVGVTDTGIGIPPDGLDRLFVPFERLDCEGSSEEGSGLGLAVSKAFVEGMGGNIKVEARPGEGSTFFLELQASQPALLPSPPGDEESVLASLPAIREDVTGKVVYLEDDERSAEFVRDVVALRPGVVLLHAARGDTGIDLIRAEHPDVVLVDLKLPGLTGAEVVQALRQDSATEAVPIVAVSADFSPVHRNSLEGHALTACLSKPIDVSQLVGTLDRILSGHSE